MQAACEVAGVLWVWQEWKMKNKGLDHNIASHMGHHMIRSCERERG